MRCPGGRTIVFGLGKSGKEPVAQGDSLVKPQQWDEAIAAYGVAITIDPNYVVAYNNRGYAYRSLGDISKSDADFQMAAWYHP